MTADPRWDELYRIVSEAKDSGDVHARVTALGTARNLVDDLLNDESAALLLTDSTSSIRSVAEATGLTDNALGPRLARSAALSSYARPDGRVTASGIARARHDHTERTGGPLKFVPRVSRSTPKEPS